MSKPHATNYITRGWSPIPIPAGSKAPRTPGWQRLRLKDASRFADGGNVGVILGDASGGLVDVDLDCPEARELADKILPPTAAIFGRASSPRSHWLYRCPGVPTTQYRDATGSLCEIRSDGHQTVFPGSVHPSGEAITWSAEGEPAEVDMATLRIAVAVLAAMCALVRAGYTVAEASAIVRDEKPLPQDSLGDLVWGWAVEACGV